MWSSDGRWLWERGKKKKKTCSIWCTISMLGKAPAAAPQARVLFFLIKSSFTSGNLCWSGPCVCSPCRTHTHTYTLVPVQTPLSCCQGVDCVCVRCPRSLSQRQVSVMAGLTATTPCSPFTKWDNMCHQSGFSLPLWHDLNILTRLW